MSFRRLSEEELNELENEFIQYLVTNGIDAPLWEKFKTEDSEKADLLIQQFSKVVFQKSLEKVKYLEHRTRNHLKLFFCDKEEIALIALESELIDLTDLSNYKAEDFQNMEMYTASKKYDANREIELYNMLENGCVITDEKLYNSLKSLL